jgi:pimeloyl-ACP methyl ester carboxylesterase
VAVVAPVLPPLAERYRVLLVDTPRFAAFRGFGPADAAELLGRFLERLRLDGVRLGGHSLGALVAAKLAARRPEQVSRLALLSPSGVPSRRGLVGHALPLLATLRAARPALAVALARDAATAGPASLLRGARYAVRTDLRPELHAVTAPTLLLWGERDRLVPPRLADEWCSELRAGRTLVVAGAGHVPMFDAPAEVAAALLAFFEEVEDEPRDAVGR